MFQSSYFISENTYNFHIFDEKSWKNKWTLNQLCENDKYVKFIYSYREKFA